MGCLKSKQYRVYVTFALLTCFPMLMIWFNKPHDLSHFTPAYAFLVSVPSLLVFLLAKKRKRFNTCLVRYFHWLVNSGVPTWWTRFIPHASRCLLALLLSMFCASCRQRIVERWGSYWLGTFSKVNR